jgi:hypothetical protein
VTRAAVAAALVGVMLLTVPARADAANPDPKQCLQVIAEMWRQGAPRAVGIRFGRIAWRESGCVAQHVIDRDDKSYSRFGLNFKGAMPAYWRRVCGVSNYRATANLRTDVKCALAAYRNAGWRPWS